MSQREVKRPPSSQTSSTSEDDTDISDYSPSPSFDVNEAIKPVVQASTPSTPSKKPKAADGKSRSSPAASPSPKKAKSNTNTKKSTESSNGHVNGVWDGEKRAAFIDEILAIGYKHANLDEIASKLGMSKRQLVDQLVPNKPNLRRKMITAAQAA
uniref:Uncharacterized protein n=1 Tax=Kwoniella dejecticola CBS 10117 TaxID=1296121 RepID=A0A1A6AGH5_9TREE|nr:uncharacterized protein I303_00950 [Kwoniella dejecticola CBS 10117]OBR89128.1 hypothetical protein I303_00950 [Kwoniella dejecticola CBS 10117]